MPLPRLGMVVSLGDRRYVRGEGGSGDEVLCLGRVSPGFWLCLFPDGALKVIHLQTKGSTRASGEVAWVMLPSERAESIDWDVIPGIVD